MQTLLIAAENITTKNPIFPEVKEIVWAIVAFVIVFVVLSWKAYPAIKMGLKAREDRIRDDLEKAEHARQEAETSLEEYKRQLADAREDAGRIIDEARQAADQVRASLVARAETDATELRARAQEDIRLATERATVDLQTKIADMTIELAEKVVERSLDRDTQLELIESYINQVGNGQRR